MLITESYAGRVFEVTRTGEIVWTWVNHVSEKDDKPTGAVVGPAHRFAPEELPFLPAGAVAEGMPIGQPQAASPSG